ncbi:hypothetical protein DFQ28_002595 [Apophysomyces sp. BC1034]|nr:hypothetical protein DFQ30_002900 [Apophysomyces sp. BC1015]KAG0179464.1 hypothetical protein DFQ29_002083 [Apophysomyces sp. BC1021]KAG0190048.1 hypothetical protein DFQ28_002595 [Apophysomyces sp. BC1034]
MVNSRSNQPILRVAVIGAGPSGLAAAKVLRDDGSFQKVVVFERNAQVGGTWIYSPDVNPNPPIPSVDILELDPPGNTKTVISPMYERLRTNLPHRVMAFRDFPFPENTPMFPSHDQVLEYLQSFANHFELRSMIRFESCITRAEHLADGWRVSVTDRNRQYEEEFDAIVVATGHYSVPHIPDIEGLGTTHIRVFHSREYRQPEIFKGQTICVMGAGSSALDIVRETSKIAKKVYHCVRTDNTRSAQALQEQPDNVIRIGPLKHFGSHHIESDEGVFEIDAVMFATGYHYSFPFLPFQKDALFARDQLKLQNLYRELFYINDPTLAFICLPMRIVPFPTSQIQSTVLARCWSGKAKIPSETEMHKENEEDPFLINSDPATFVMPKDREIRYMDTLSAWAEGVEIGTDWQPTDVVTMPIPDWWREMRPIALDLRKKHLGY